MRRALQPTLPLLLLAMLLATSTLMMVGCAPVRFISDYDSVLDDDVTNLQKDTETFLNQLDSEVGTAAAAYSKNTDFYIKADAALRTMATRAASEPKSKIIVEQIQTLQGTFDKLKKLHEMSADKGLSSADISDTRSALEVEFTSILTLELALKSRSAAQAMSVPAAKTK